MTGSGCCIDRNSDRKLEACPRIPVATNIGDEQVLWSLPEETDRILIRLRDIDMNSERLKGLLLGSDPVRVIIDPEHASTTKDSRIRSRAACQSGLRHARDRDVLGFGRVGNCSIELRFGPTRELNAAQTLQPGRDLRPPGRLKAPKGTCLIFA